MVHMTNCNLRASQHGRTQIFLLPAVCAWNRKAIFECCFHLESRDLDLLLLALLLPHTFGLGWCLFGSFEEFAVLHVDETVSLQHTHELPAVMNKD